MLNQKSILFSNPNAFFLIDIFRFIAASLVLLVHLSYIFQVSTVWDIFASSAVSWFFIVSGFILSYRYPELTILELKHFYVFRLARIYPAYFLSLLLAMGFTSWGYFWIGHDFFAQIGRPVIGTYDLPQTMDGFFWLLGIVQHLFFLQFISTIDCLKYLFNGPLWSVVDEAFFYLLFPLLLPIARLCHKGLTLFIVFLACYALQYWLIRAFLPEYPLDWYNLNTPIYTNPFVRWVEFFIGMLLYRVYLILPEIKLSLRFLWLGIAFVLYFLTLVVMPYAPHQYTLFFLMIPSTALLVLTLVNIGFTLPNQLRHFCTLLGGVSYVLYCIHFPLMEIFHFIGLQTWINSPILLIFVIYSIILFFSFLIHITIETHLRKRIIRRLLSLGTK